MTHSEEEGSLLSRTVSAGVDVDSVIELKKCGVDKVLHRVRHSLSDSMKRKIAMLTK